MKLRNWLLAGTSLTLLALAPIGVARAQDAGNPAVQQAYAAYQAKQSKGNRRALTDACTTAGFSGLEDCVAAVSGAAPIEQTQQAEEAAPSSDEAAPPASSEEPVKKPVKKKKASSSAEEAAPVTEEAAPVSEDAAPVSEEAPVSEDAAPVSSEEAAPVASSEEPAPKAKKKAKAVTSSVEEAAPVSSEVAAPVSSEEPAPVSSEEAAPVTSEAAPVSSEEAAPVSSEEAAPLASSEEAAPVSSEAPSSAAPAGGALAQLTAAVGLYNEGAAQLDAGDASGQAKVDQASGQINQICSDAGFADTDACLAQFGLSLNPLPPAQASAPASDQTTSSAEPLASSEAPAAQDSSAADQTASSEEPVSELPNASEDVSPSAVEPLPADVSQEAAPLLDSQKRAPKGKGNGNGDNDSSSEAPAADTTSSASEQQQPPAPPPQDDKSAQQDIQPPPAEVQSTQTEQGRRKSADFTFVEPKPPADAKPVQAPKNDKGSFVFQIGVNFYITNPEQERNRFYDRNRGDEIYYEDLSRGRTRETIERRDGTRVVTIYASNGDVLQRSKFIPGGREIVLSSYDPQFYDNGEADWSDPGDELPPLQLNIPADQYILDADTADENQVEVFLSQPPVEQVRRIYTIDEVKRSARLRDSVRRLEIGNLTFDTGKATIARDQVGTLAGVAKAMQDLLAKDPGEVFLIEGHTDAVGDDISNLALSDNRAATVARILTDFYQIPAENLVTQGYGEQYLKVQTDASEPLNRRVTVKRITPLVSYEAAN